MDFLLNLHGYQKDAVNFLYENKRSILGDDIGLGKTVEILGLINELIKTGEFKGAVILSPLSVQKEWLWHVREYCKGLSITTVPDPYVDIVLLTYPYFRNNHSRIDLGKRDLIIFDEANAFKNRTSKLAKELRKVTPEYNRVISATGCTTLMTRVCSSKGLVRAEEVKVGDDLFLGGTVLEVIDNGVTSVCELILDTGMKLKGTLDHPVKTINGWTFLQDLRIGDEVAIPYGKSYGVKENLNLRFPGVKDCGRNNVSFLKESDLDESWGSFIGWIVGDGYLPKRANKVELYYNKTEEDVKKIFENFIRYFGWRFSIKEYFYQKEVCRIIVSSCQLGRLLAFIGVSRGEKTVVPELIFKSPVSVQCSFLRALFTADGRVGVYNKRKRLGLKSSSLKLLEGVQFLLQNIGVMSRIRGRELNVLSPFVEKFKEKVGFLGRKQKILESLDLFLPSKTIRKCYKSDFMFSKVVSLKRVESERTIGFKLDKEIYVTEGILSHNTPIQNNLVDFYSILEVTLSGTESLDFLPYEEFKLRFLTTVPMFVRGRYNSFYKEIVVGYKDVPIFMAYFKSLVLRRTYNDIKEKDPVASSIIERPALVEKVQPIKMGNDQRELYDRILNSSYNPSQDKFNLFTVFTRLVEAATYPYLIDGYHGSCAKLSTALRFIKICLEQNKKVICCCLYHAELNFFKNEFPSSYIISGLTPLGERISIINRFLQGEANVLFSTSVTEQGLNMQAVDVIFFYDRIPNPARLDQFLGRAWRQGRKLPVICVHFVSQDTVDERMLSVITRKRKLFGKAFTSLSRADLIEMMRTSKRGQKYSVYKEVSSKLTNKEQTKLMMERNGNGDFKG